MHTHECTYTLNDACSHYGIGMIEYSYCKLYSVVHAHAFMQILLVLLLFPPSSASLTIIFVRVLEPRGQCSC